MENTPGMVEESMATLKDLDDKGVPLDERVSTPFGLRQIHTAFKLNDADGAANRAATQELVDFVPPYDPEELANRGQADRFNVNFGMVAAIKNEAVGSYHDIFTTPTALLEMSLNHSVASEDKEQWAAIMSEEFTTMLRSWDAATPQMLLLDDLIVTHGIGIPWFEDSNNIQFEVAGMEDFNFDDDQVAISSKVEACTVERDMSVSKIFSKIDGKEADETGFTSQGWNKAMIIELIRRSSIKQSSHDTWDFEQLQRDIKGNRVTGGKNLPSIRLVWGFIRELDGTYSIYACAEDNGSSPGNPQNSDTPNEETWVFRQRGKYRDANQAFQIFTFGIGNKNCIHTIRGLAYFLYEAGQADNVIKCKALDSARMRASEIYQPSGGIESEQDMQMLDIGSAVIIPQSLRGVQSQTGHPLDKTIGVAQDITREVMDRHSGGLASQGALQNPAARRNELQVAAELDQMAKLLNFAINLYYPPFEKLLREIARRAFTQTQTDLETIELVKDMKKRILERGVPREMFSQIDLKRSKVSRVMGAGSRGTRMLIFSQMSQLFPEMDAEGKEKFTFDWATEMVGHDRSLRYFGRPSERRGHVDVSIAKLENGRMMEGDYIEPTDGENQMVHLLIHVEEGLEPALEAVEAGDMTLEEFVTTHVTLFQHAEQTLQSTTVHESGITELNSIRQRLQQIGEVIENGLRQLNAKARKEQQEGGGGQEPGQPGEADPQAEQDQKLENSAQELNLKLQAEVAKTNARIEEMRKMSDAKIALDQSESMAKMAIMDRETRRKLESAQILERAKKS